MPTIRAFRPVLRPGLLVLLVAAFWGSAMAQVPPGPAQAPPAASSPATAELAADEAVRRLLDVLEDEAARGLLLERLRETAPPPADEASEPAQLAQRLAASSSALVRDNAARIGRAWREIAALGRVPSRLASGASGIAAEARALALTIAATIAAALLLGLGVRRVGKRFEPRPLDPFLRRGTGALAFLALRLGAVALAWAVGHAVAALAIAETAAPFGAPSLYLNAFAFFGIVRALLRVAVSPDADSEPSLSRLAPGAQAVVYRSLRAIAGVLIQGLFFLVPLSHLWLGFATARSLRTLTVSVAAAVALVAVVRVRHALVLGRDDRPQRSGTAAEAGATVVRGAETLWKGVWPPLAVAYVIYAWFVAVTQPARMNEVVLGGTFYTMVAVALLLAALRLLRAVPGLRAPLPRPLAAWAPRLGPRADGIAAALAWVAAALAILGCVALFVHGWGWIDVRAWMRGPAVQPVLWRGVSAVLVAFAAAATWAVVASWIDVRLTRELAGGNVSARSRTLLALFRNAFTITLAILATMITLSQIGIDIAPLLAGAGVIGLAIGFGAQKLVQDIITGIFIQLENAINEGDVVGVAGITGGVEKVTIRSVRLRTMDGAVHIVPFSSVGTVTNMTRDFGFHVAEFGVGYGEKLPTVTAALEEAFARLRTQVPAEHILEPLEMQGVVALGESAVTVRARIKTLPGKHWEIGRRFTELARDVFAERGINLPYPHRRIILPEGFLPPKDKEAGGG